MKKWTWVLHGMTTEWIQHTEGTSRWCRWFGHRWKFVYGWLVKCKNCPAEAHLYEPEPGG